MNNSETDLTFILSGDTHTGPQAEDTTEPHFGKQLCGKKPVQAEHQRGKPASPLDRITVNTTAAAYQRDNLEQVQGIHMHLLQLTTIGRMSVCVCVCVCVRVCHQIKIKGLINGGHCLNVPS